MGTAITDPIMDTRQKRLVNYTIAEQDRTRRGRGSGRMQMRSEACLRTYCIRKALETKSDAESSVRVVEWQWLAMRNGPSRREERREWEWVSEREREREREREQWAASTNDSGSGAWGRPGGRSRCRCRWGSRLRAHVEVRVLRAFVDARAHAPREPERRELAALVEQQRGHVIGAQRTQLQIYEQTPVNRWHSSRKLIRIKNSLNRCSYFGIRVSSSSSVRVQRQL